MSTLANKYERNKASKKGNFETDHSRARLKHNLLELELVQKPKIVNVAVLNNKMQVTSFRPWGRAYSTTHEARN